MSAFLPSDSKRASTSRLDELFREMSSRKLPPVDSWKPQTAGVLDIKITTNGKWYYEGSEITRYPLIKLFSTILRLENDEYFLITPVEKIKIFVEDAPFIATEMQVLMKEDRQTLLFRTNVEEVVEAGKENPITFSRHRESDQILPAVHIRSGLYAKLSRPVYYELVNLALESDNSRSGHLNDDESHPGVWSNGNYFSLQP